MSLRPYMADGPDVPVGGIEGSCCSLQVQVVGLKSHKCQRVIKVGFTICRSIERPRK